MLNQLDTVEIWHYTGQFYTYITLSLYRFLFHLKTSCKQTETNLVSFILQLISYKFI